MYIYIYMHISTMTILYIYIYGAVLAGPPPSHPMGGGSKGFPPPCGVGVVCGIVVVYRFPPPRGVGVVYSIVVV